jgi:hypothetical protein
LFIPNTISFLKVIKAVPDIPTNDYLILARFKEENKDFDDAIKYLKIYKEQIDDSKVNLKIDQKIDDIRNKLFQ